MKKAAGLFVLSLYYYAHVALVLKRTITLDDAPRAAESDRPSVQVSILGSINTQLSLALLATTLIDDRPQSAGQAITLMDRSLSVYSVTALLKGRWFSLLSK